MGELGLMCLMTLGAPAPLDPEAALAELGQTAPRSDLAVRPAEAGEGESGLAVRIDGHDFAAVIVPDQLPDEAREAALHGLPLWPGRAEAIAAHGAFIALAAAEQTRGHGLVRAQAVALIRLAAALARCVPITALVWPSAANAAAPERLQRAVADISTGGWPVDIWVGFDFLGARHAGARAVGARTRGAAVFLGAEIEVAAVFDTPTEPLRILAALTGQLMARGAYLRNGQTFELPGSRRLRCVTVQPRSGLPGLIRMVPDEAAAG